MCRPLQSDVVLQKCNVRLRFIGFLVSLSLIFSSLSFAGEINTEVSFGSIEAKSEGVQTAWVFG